MTKKYFHFLLVLFLLLLPGLLQSQNNNSVYNISIPALSGEQVIKLSDYSGKKILIVNVARLSDRANQLKDLNELARLAGEDSLVIIICPSNSFDHEQGNQNEVRNYYAGITGPGIKITVPVTVTGNEKHALYNWLGSKILNGVMSGRVINDFNKFLISENGTLIGFFGKEINPVDPLMLRVLKLDNN